MSNLEKSIIFVLLIDSVMELCVLLGTVNTFHDYPGLFWSWLFKYALD